MKTTRKLLLNTYKNINLQDIATTDSRGVRLQDEDIVCVFTESGRTVWSLLKQTQEGLFYTLVVPMDSSYTCVLAKDTQETIIGKVFKLRKFNITEIFKNLDKVVIEIQETIIGNLFTLGKSNNTASFSNLGNVMTEIQRNTPQIELTQYSVYDLGFVSHYREQLYLRSTRKSSLKGFGIHEYFNRELKRGDLVVYFEKSSKLPHYGIILDKHYIYSESRKREKAYHVCLLTSKTNDEILLQKALNSEVQAVAK